MSTDRWSDAALRADLDSPLRGSRAAAEILLAVPEEVRSDLWAEAWTLGNLRNGGRFSDDLREAVRVWRSTGRFPARATAAEWRERNSLISRLI
jgi:hypothetical protein